MYKQLMLLFFLFFSSHAMAQNAPKKQALLVGVSDYMGTEYDLPGIDQDIEKMRGLLKTWGFEVKVLWNQESVHLQQALVKYSRGKNKLLEGDTFIFYFSGHGSFVADKNGDEPDRQDETLVLSNGVTNSSLLDDHLDHYFSQIKARTLQIYDSCHSGTVNKGQRAKDKGVQKTIPASELSNAIALQKPRLDKRTGKSGESIVMSAAKDTETSLSLPTGSPFTNELVALFSDFSNQQKPLQTVYSHIAYNVVRHSIRHQQNRYNPQLSVSDPSLKKISLSKYLMIRH